jgi:hypothetical protein
MQESEEIKCGKCFSLSSSSMDYCRYCHRKFSYSSKVTEEAGLRGKRKITKLVIAGTCLVVLMASYTILK